MGLPRTWRIGAVALLVALVLGAGFMPLRAKPALSAPPEAAELAGEHPAEYYLRAAAMFKDGRKDDAVFVFYLGQLRYRTYLMAHPDLQPDGDPALFESLSEGVGVPLNEYAGGDIPAFARTIEAVLAYDTANPDRFTPPAEFAQAHAAVREGLQTMRRQILAERNSIRAQRAKKGLPNRN